jgi:hypothetical protein
MMPEVETKLLGKKASFVIKSKERINGSTHWIDEAYVGEIVAVATNLQSRQSNANIDYYYLLKLHDGRTVTKKHSDCKFVE